jgi:hypothetical protein
MSHQAEDDKSLFWDNEAGESVLNLQIISQQNSFLFQWPSNTLLFVLGVFVI